MKFKLLFACLLLIPSFANSVFAQTASSLDALYRSKQFFELRDAAAKRERDKSAEMLFYRGAVANKFNQSEKSAALLRNFLKTAKPGDASLQDAYELLADDYVKTFQYAKAAETYQLIMEKFADKLAPEKKKDFENSAKLWNALGKIAPQTVSFVGDTHLKATRDKARLMNVPVEINDVRMDFVFDTGANLSTVTASTAQKLGLKIIEADISVGSTTSNKVNSKLGVAPQMKIGSMTFRNVVFLVVEDKALSFPQANYQINGIVGFPVIEAMRVVTIKKTDEIVVLGHAPKIRFEQNMCLDELTPVALATFNNRKMSFTFDTGAQTSSFYPAFFKAEEASIKQNYKPQTVKIGGAGGFNEIEAYVLKDVNLTIGGKHAALKQIEVLTAPTNEDSRHFYGNLGQDLIRQFDSLTLDFAGMSLIFE